MIEGKSVRSEEPAKKLKDDFKFQQNAKSE